MPRIPIQTQQFQPTQEQSVQPLQATFGGNIAQAQYQTGKVIEQMGQVAGQIGQQFQAQQEKIDELRKNQKEEQDKIKSVYLQNEVKQNFNSYLYDPDKGLLNKSGVNAFGATNEFTKEAYEKLRPEYERKLKSSGIDEDTALYELAKFDSDLNTYQKQVSEHESREQKTAYKNSFNASLDMNYQELAQYRNEPHYYGMLNRSRNEIYDYGKKNGWTDEEIETKRVTEATRMFGLIVEPLIKDHPKEAERLLKDNKSFIDPNKTEAYADLIQKGKDSIFVNKITSEINDAYLKRDDLSGALTQVDKMKIGLDISEKLKTSIKNKYNENEMLRRENEDLIGDNVLSRIDDGIKKKLPASSLQKIVDQMPERMIKEKITFSRMIENAYDVKKDPNSKFTTEDFMQMTTELETGAYQNKNQFFKSWGGRMSRSTFEGYINKYFDDKGNYDYLNKKAPEFKIGKEDVLKLSGLTGKKTDKEAVVDELQFWSRFNESVAEFKAKSPKIPVTYEVKQQIIDSLRNKVKIETGKRDWFGLVKEVVETETYKVQTLKDPKTGKTYTKINGKYVEVKR